MPEPGPVAAGALAESPLLEREQELRALDRLVGTGARGDCRRVFIEGTAGIGKSRLIAELWAHGRSRGMRVLSAHGSDLEREFPLGVVRQLFEPLLAATAERERLLVDAAAAAAPVFENVHPDDPGDGDVSLAALHGLYWLIANIVEHPADASAFFDPETWARLRQIKALYDPQDIFKGNHHAPPAS